jgi:hypothetical protein
VEIPPGLVRENKTNEKTIPVSAALYSHGRLEVCNPRLVESTRKPRALNAFM